MDGVVHVGVWGLVRGSGLYSGGKINFEFEFEVGGERWQKEKMYSAMRCIPDGLTQSGKREAGGPGRKSLELRHRAFVE